MSEEKKWPVSLKVHIEPEGLKQVVEEGRLMEFVNAFSVLAAGHIRRHVVEQLAESGVGITKVGEGIRIDVGFDIDDPYGIGPKPSPLPWPRFSTSWFAIETVPLPERSWLAIDTVPLPEQPVFEMFRRIVREELDRIK